MLNRKDIIEALLFKPLDRPGLKADFRFDPTVRPDLNYGSGNLNLGHIAEKLNIKVRELVSSAYKQGLRDAALALDEAARPVYALEEAEQVFADKDQRVTEDPAGNAWTNLGPAVTGDDSNSHSVYSANPFEDETDAERDARIGRMIRDNADKQAKSED